MINIQNWLIQNNFNYPLLEEQLSIKANFHPTDERVILNYCQINSPKTNSLVREARGLILNRYTAELIGRGFSRFFNVGEDKESLDNFSWDNCYINEKLDGSLIICHHYDNKWRVNTRNSYGDGVVGDSGLTWFDVFNQALYTHALTVENLGLVADEKSSLVFELCSPYNQVVQFHKEPTLFLLAIFDGEVERNPVDVDEFAKQHGLNRPQRVHCSDILQVENYIRSKSELDKCFEGLVINDCKNIRLKAKSPTYVSLHRLSNNGNIASWKNIVPIAMAGECEEILSYFPYIRERFEIAQTTIDKLVKELDNIWFCHWDQKSRKKFAEEVKSHPFSCLLFASYGKTYEEVNIRQELVKFSDKLVSYLEEKYK